MFLHENDQNSGRLLFCQLANQLIIFCVNFISTFHGSNAISKPCTLYQNIILVGKYYILFIFWPKHCQIEEHKQLNQPYIIHHV